MWQLWGHYAKLEKEKYHIREVEKETKLTREQTGCCQRWGKMCEAGKMCEGSQKVQLPVIKCHDKISHEDVM